MTYALATFGRRLRTLRISRGLSQVELARRIGRHQTTIGPYERDEYAPAIDVVERLAEALETTPEYLVFGRTASKNAIIIAGRIANAGIFQATKLDDAETVLVSDRNIVGYWIEDDCMAPAYRPGHVVIVFGTPARMPADLLGSDVVAELQDGRILLRRLMPSAEADRFDLAAYNAPTILSASVALARRVVGFLDQRLISSRDELHSISE